MALAGDQVEAARTVAEVMRRFAPHAHLSMGGGTVLQHRWAHRKSPDVGLFCSPGAFAEAMRDHRGVIEDALMEAGADAERTWCEPLALYAEIRGVETTVLPAAALTRRLMTKGEGPDALVAPVALQTNAEILAKKLLHRLFEGEVAEVRDIYDLAAAQEMDRAALRVACAVLPERALASIVALVSALPSGWGRVTNKPLLSPRFAWTEDEMAERATSALLAGASAVVRSHTADGRKCP